MYFPDGALPTAAEVHPEVPALHNYLVTDLNTSSHEIVSDPISFIQF